MPASRHAISRNWQARAPEGRAAGGASPNTCRIRLATGTTGRNWPERAAKLFGGVRDSALVAALAQCDSRQVSPGGKCFRRKPETHIAAKEAGFGARRSAGRSAQPATIPEQCRRLALSASLFVVLSSSFLPPRFELPLLTAKPVDTSEIRAQFALLAFSILKVNLYRATIYRETIYQMIARNRRPEAILQLAAGSSRVSLSAYEAFCNSASTRPSSRRCIPGNISSCCRWPAPRQSCSDHASPMRRSALGLRHNSAVELVNRSVGRRFGEPQLRCAGSPTSGARKLPPREEGSEEICPADMPANCANLARLDSRR